MLRQRAEASAKVRRMNELDQVVRQHAPKNAPDQFYATSGESRTERGTDRWMPHDFKPIIGFSPNI